MIITKKITEVFTQAPPPPNLETRPDYFESDSEACVEYWQTLVTEETRLASELNTYSSEVNTLSFQIENTANNVAENAEDALSARNEARAYRDEAKASELNIQNFTVPDGTSYSTDSIDATTTAIYFAIGDNTLANLNQDDELQRLRNKT